MNPKYYSIIAGVGAGTGRSVALRFARAYPVALLARSPQSYSDIVTEINSNGGQAIGISTDTTDPQSVKSAFESIKTQFSDKKLAAAIFNVGGSFIMKPFLELPAADFDSLLSANVKSLFNFSQATLPLLLDTVPTPPDNGGPPTLIITGATASLRGGAQLAAFAAGKFAVRAVAQSLAREFGPKGVHVAHVIVDGIIDIPRTKGWVANDGKEDGKLDPGAIAESYWHLHSQPRSAFTHELDLRPYVEKF